MPPRKKELSAEDEKLVNDVKAALDNESDKNASETGEGAAQGDSETDKPTDTEETGPSDDSEADPVELVTVSEPCAKCFPAGWPAQEEDVFVNCAHHHAIRFGELVAITKERAKELGFVERPAQ